MAPYAMRMTADMLTNMPAALKLAIAGARALRYAPHGTTPTKGKTKSAQAKKPNKRKHTEEQTKTIVAGEATAITGSSTTTEQVERAGGSASFTTSTPSNDERII